MDEDQDKKRVVKEHDVDCVLTGLRAEESRARMCLTPGDAVPFTCCKGYGEEGCSITWKAVENGW